MPKGVEVPFKKLHRDFGWVRCSPWHWQIKLPDGILDYWPSRTRWMWQRTVRQGSFEQVSAFISTRQMPTERPKTALYQRTIPLDEDDTFVGGDVNGYDERGWKLPCSDCGGGLFWRRKDEDPWVCGACHKFAGRGLSSNWLTTPAWGVMLDRIAEKSRMSAGAK